MKRLYKFKLTKIRMMISLGLCLFLMAGEMVVNAGELGDNMDNSPKSSSDICIQLPQNNGNVARPITVYAQLVDKNYNCVASKGKKINFTYGDSNTRILETSTEIPGTNITVVSMSKETDSAGRVQITLEAAQKDVLNNLSATIVEQNSEGYQVVMVDGTSQYYSLNISWVGLFFYVQYDANGGEGAPSSQIQNEEGEVILCNTKPTRDGYTFQGWSTSRNTASAMYQPGDVITLDRELTLYAVWKKNTYSVSYDANGGEGAPSSQIQNEEREVILSNTKPTRDGYTFRGWSTSRNTVSATYQPGDSITLDRDLTLYAVWKADDSNSNIDLPDPKEDVPSQQIITADSQVIDKGTKPFYITAETSGDGKLTYKSGNTKVISISSTGKVVVRGYGKAVVTIRASKTAQYEAALKEITITVVPQKAGIVKATSSKRKTLYVLWKKDMTVDGYQVNFSTRKDFKSNTYKREYSKSSTHMRTIGLKSNQTYYVRIRSYVKVGGKKYYGAWSTVKRVKIK